MSGDITEIITTGSTLPVATSGGVRVQDNQPPPLNGLGIDLSLSPETYLYLIYDHLIRAGYSKEDANRIVQDERDSMKEWHVGLQDDTPLLTVDVVDVFKEEDPIQEIMVIGRTVTAIKGIDIFEPIGVPAVGDLVDKLTKVAMKATLIFTALTPTKTVTTEDELKQLEEFATINDRGDITLKAGALPGQGGVIATQDGTFEFDGKGVPVRVFSDVGTVSVRRGASTTDFVIDTGGVRADIFTDTPWYMDPEQEAGYIETTTYDPALDPTSSPRFLDQDWLQEQKRAKAFSDTLSVAIDWSPGMSDRPGSKIPYLGPDAFPHDTSGLSGAGLGVNGWTDRVPDAIPPFSIDITSGVVPGETVLRVRLEKSRAEAGEIVSEAAPSNTIKDKKTHSQKRYMAALRFINSTWGRVSEVIDTLNALQANLYFVEDKIVCVGRQCIKVKQGQAFSELPVKYRQALLTTFSESGLNVGVTSEGNDIYLNVAGFVETVAVQQVSDIAIAEIGRFEADLVRDDPILGNMLGNPTTQIGRYLDLTNFTGK